MARKKNQTNRKKKRKSTNRFKIGYLITLLVLIPICYGLYLYLKQPEAPASSPVVTVESPVATTPATEPPAAPAPATRQPVASIPKRMPSADELSIPRMGTSEKGQLIRHAGYIVSYNEKLRLPNWVAYELTRQETKGNARRTDRFIADPLVKGVIATNSDYTRSGYDKGHMAPAADMKWSNTAMKESFYFSNMCPQHPQLNRRKWKDLEEKIRDRAIADSALIIVCGPIMGKVPKKIGKNQVAVPQGFFKVILSPFVASPRAIGFLFKNERSVSPLATYAVSVDSVEKLTGMDFFSALPDELENRIEAEANCSQWGF